MCTESQGSQEKVIDIDDDPDAITEEASCVDDDKNIDNCAENEEDNEGSSNNDGNFSPDDGSKSSNRDEGEENDDDYVAPRGACVRDLFAFDLQGHIPDLGGDYCKSIIIITVDKKRYRQCERRD